MKLTPWVLRLLQGLLYALVIVGVLQLLRVFGAEPANEAYGGLGLLAGVFGFLLMYRYDLLTPWLTGRPGSVGSSVLRAWMSLVVALLVVGYLGGYGASLSPPLMLAWALLTPLALLLVHRLALSIARIALPHLIRRRTAALVFVNDTARQLAQNLARSPVYELVGFFDDREPERHGAALMGLPYLGRVQSVTRYVHDHRIEAVFVVLPEDGGRRALNLVDDLGESGARVYYAPDFAMLNLLGAQLREIEGVGLLQLPDRPVYGADGSLKRVLDISISGLLLLLLTPLLLTVALALRLNAPALPVLLKQRRYSLSGKRYSAYRFRAADRVDESQPGSRAASALIRFIRRFSIDQLPQLFNVLRGEMSLVGPRAHTVAHNEFYRRAIRSQIVRHRVRPGLTGWAQVHGLHGGNGNLEDMEDRVRYDLEYIRKWSPWLDLRILLQTFAMILREPWR
ncbi:MAG: exopolysaccharide biosynthesis polyprenyl glycosylphosphotransferase [Panacagrimonas sp.]